MLKKTLILILGLSLMAVWSPQPGPQAMAAVCPADFPLFGGSRGGGKSDCLLGRHLRGAEKYKRHWNGLIVRRKYKDFLELRRRIDEFIMMGLKAERIGGDQQTNYLRFKNGAQVAMPAISRLEMVNDFIGHQYCEISIDEVTTFPFFSRMVDKLKGSNRSPHGVPCHLFGTGNPGGPGHSDVKEYFKLGSSSPVKPGQVWEGEGGESRVFIPSFLDDNRILCEADPKYVNRLKAIRDPALRRAWILGDWDVFIGQAFPFSYERHVIPPIQIPQYAPIYMTFDWGYAKPFSFGWWWLDADNRLYRFAEWYGWNKTPDEGLRLTDSVMVEGVKEREQKMGIGTRKIIRLCDPTCFNKKPDYRGGGQGPSTAEVFGQHGIYLVPGDPSRELKIRQFRERMAIPTNEMEMPMMVIYENCTHFVRTIPALCMDENRPEDIDTETEDHVYDEACLIAMSRPLSLKAPITSQSSYDLRIDRLIRGDRDDFEDFATVQHEITKRHLGADQTKYNAENYEDGDTVPTVS